MEFQVGRITRASTTRFAVGCQILKSDPKVPIFGALVKVPAGDVEVYGLIYDVRMDDDPFVRQVATTDDVPLEIIEDQRRSRQIPIEVSVLAVGYRQGAQIHHRLPPQPPISLDMLRTCRDTELVAFTAQFDYFRLVLDCRDLSADELLAANLRYAAAARDGGGRGFLLDAGRELARLLPMDLARLDAILRRIRP